MSMLSTVLKTGNTFSRDRMHGYQDRATRFIKDTPYCALWVDMGLGKSIATLTALVDLLHDFTIGKVLIIAPKRVVNHTWPTEINLWQHTRRMSVTNLCLPKSKRGFAALNDTADLTLINRENVSWLVSFWQENWPYDTVILDESTSFKSPSSYRFRALKKVRKYIDRIVELTGTPAPNGYLDLWSQIYLLDQGERLGRTLTAYKQTYFVSDYMGFNWTLKDGAKEKINAKLKDIVLRLDGADYLKLPHRIENTLWLDLPPGAVKQYRELEREYLLEIGDTEVEALSAAALSNKLLQFCNGAVYDDEGVSTVVHNTKMDALEEVIEGAAGQPVLVAYAYRSERDRIKVAFSQAVLIDEPDAINRWNRGEIGMLVAHPAGAGHGLNLQKGGNIIVWFGLTWSLELYQQLNARLHRQGQTKPVFIHRLAINSSIDGTVLDALDRKDTAQASLLRALKTDMESRQ